MSEKSPEKLAAANDFLPIRVSTLRGDLKISFDLYCLINSKHILYIRKGDSFEGARLNRLKERKLRKLYIRPGDEPGYRSYLDTNIEQAYDKNSKQSLENRTAVVHGLQQSAGDAVFENPQDAEAYKEAKEGAQRFAQFLMQEDEAIRSLLTLENTEQDLVHHGVTVAGLAMMIAKKSGYSDERNLGFLALGALIHDLGHQGSGLQIARPLAQFTSEDKIKYQHHPVDGANRIKDLRHIDQHVVQIMLEHEEEIGGNGFPFGRNEKQLNPLSVFVSSANVYDRLITFERMSHADAIKKIFLEMLGKHPLAHYNALKSLAKQ